MMYFLGVIYLFLCISQSYCSITYNLNISGESQHGYYVTLFLGTPPQQINLLLDSGSSNIAVASGPITPGSLTYFRYNESKTLHQLDIAVDLHYVVGRWNGFLAKDILNFDNISVEYTIACMTSIQQIFDDSSQFQGLLGLAYPSIAIPDSSVQPFLNELVELQNIPDMFSLDLCGPYFSTKEQTTKCGKFHIGYISKLYSINDIVYTPIIKEWYYEVTLTDLRIGGNSMPFGCEELNKDRSVIDTGTTDLRLPTPVYNWAVSEIKKSVLPFIANKYWTNETTACLPYDQIDFSKFPTITLSFYHTKNSTFDLHISSDLYLVPIRDHFTNSECFKFSLAASEDGVLIGASMLRGFYVVFDRQDRRIGFANNRHFNSTTGFPGAVTKPKYTNKNIQLCIKHPKSSDMSPLMIVILVATVVVAIVLLYMLISWIFRYFFMQSGDSSETSSLVDGIVLETLK